MVTCCQRLQNKGLDGEPDEMISSMVCVSAYLC